jgi:hypothetical protein
MLKKITMTVTILVALTGLSHGLANPDWIENVPGLNFKTSNNVKIAYKWDTSGSSTQNYALVAKHSAGNTYYATSNMSTAIFKSTWKGEQHFDFQLSDPLITGLKAGESVFQPYYNPM